MITIKIGGSSLRNTDSLKRVVKVVQSYDSDDLVIVLSAVSGVTDHLLKSINDVLESDKKVEGLLDYLFMLHKELIMDVISSISLRRQVFDEIDYLLSRLEKLLFGIAYTGECSKRARDMVISMGERLAIQLVAGCLNDHGIAAKPLEADKIGMIASGEFGNGNADMAATRQQLPDTINPLLQAKQIPIVTGFFASTHDHHTITFGRGGTDYSAAVIASVMDCDELHIWKDVDGFLTADPIIVENALPIQYLGYHEAAELSYFGAEILHPRTVEPLEDNNILAVIKNTFRPEVRGTIIGPERMLKDNVIKSVTYNRKIGSLRIDGPSIGQQVGFLHHVVATLSDHGINIISVITSQTAVNLLLEKKDVPRAEGLIRALNIPYIESLEPVIDVSLVGVVGEGLAETKGLAARVFGAVANAGTNVEMIVSGASRVAQYFIIKERDIEKTIHAIHDEFF